MQVPTFTAYYAKELFSNATTNLGINMIQNYHELKISNHATKEMREKKRILSLPLSDIVPMPKNDPLSLFANAKRIRY